ncbi:hypothetical protein VE04_01637 [Pseudogymnoascus sp. 24MN13]|nr:hypothetical protein VE04_01637 [Pseudogymnoascus sp. 24MN13]
MSNTLHIPTSSNQNLATMHFILVTPETLRNRKLNSSEFSYDRSCIYYAAPAGPSQLGKWTLLLENPSVTGPINNPSNLRLLVHLPQHCVVVTNTDRATVSSPPFFPSTPTYAIIHTCNLTISTVYPL